MITQEIKDGLIAEAIHHREQDMLIKGQFWAYHKGCSVGCFVKTEDRPHAKLAARSGMPEWIHHLQDSIFENLPEDDCFYWSERFFKAAPVGLSHEQYNVQIKAPFMVFTLRSALETFDHKKHPDVKKAIDTVIKLYEDGEVDLSKFRDAADAAYAAAAAAYADAADAAYAADAYADAADSAAAYAAYDAADADADAADAAAADAADVAAAAADAAADADAADAAAAYAAAAYADADAADAAAAYATYAYATYAATGKRMREFADELIRLMESAK